MTRTFRLRHAVLPATLAASLLAMPMLALAQTATTPGNMPSNPPGTMLDRAAAGAAAMAQGATAGLVSGLTPNAAAVARPRMSQLISANVYNDRNERIGEIDDVILVMPDSLGTAAASGPVAVIQVGGFLGIGGRLVTVPLGELLWNREQERVVLTGATKESLQARTAFEYAMLRQR
jgi:hypothetical protein